MIDIGLNLRTGFIWIVCDIDFTIYMNVLRLLVILWLSDQVNVCFLILIEVAQHSNRSFAIDGYFCASWIRPMTMNSYKFVERTLNISCRYKNTRPIRVANPRDSYYLGLSHKKSTTRFLLHFLSFFLFNLFEERMKSAQYSIKMMFVEWHK